MTRFPQGWEPQALFLTECTPLTERQAEIVALLKTDHGKDEIARTLRLRPSTVTEHWKDIKDQLRHAQTLCTIMGPHANGDGETRESDNIDTWPWTLVSSGALNNDDEERTRLELELYVGTRGPGGHSYLLMEREIIGDGSFATKTTEKRSAHGLNGLREYIYANADTLDEYYLRYGLLHKGGVDPLGHSALGVQSVVDGDILQDEREAARKRGLKRVERRGVNYPGLLNR